VSQVPGFVAGYWTRKGNEGLSMVVFDSEAAANGMSERVRSMAPEGVTIEDIEVREVVAHA
jgi:stage III sporulation protein SpoIIIAA